MTAVRSRLHVAVAALLLAGSGGGVLVHAMKAGTWPSSVAGLTDIQAWEFAQFSSASATATTTPPMPPRRPKPTGWSRPASASAMRLLKRATRPGIADPPGAGIAGPFPLNAAEAAREPICRPQRTPSPDVIRSSQNRTLTAQACRAETRL
jgi:hypothetical protein